MLDDIEQLGVINLLRGEFAALVLRNITGWLVSLTCCTLKTSGKITSWVQWVHIIIDNAGLSNKNQYMMAMILEILQ